MAEPGTKCTPTALCPCCRIDHVAKPFGKTRAVDGVSPRYQRERILRAARPIRLRQDHAAADARRVRDAGRGQILLSGNDIAPLPPEKRPLNLMFQSYALFPHMRVRQNLNYGLEMERLPREEIRSTRRRDAGLDGPAALADRKPDQLSGGQKQRVALARALVKRPKVLLLDEPLGALDKKLREAMQLELKRLQHEAGITFIIVTHDQEEALVMADRMAILKDGKLLQCGTPRGDLRAAGRPLRRQFHRHDEFPRGRDRRHAAPSSSMAAGHPMPPSAVTGRARRRLRFGPNMSRDHRSGRRRRRRRRSPTRLSRARPGAACARRRSGHRFSFASAPTEGQKYAAGQAVTSSPSMPPNAGFTD